ncbi:MAG TPA: bifunctional oligoribonuclease/PAP phosphatase NrnA [Candidatus Omnitrophota bacterium]|nr:bifunctional oligoribonuclease/PAP phosphatase NrnA [Candidatus Omnitrophota bacterium]
MSLNQICRDLKKYNNFLITAHTSPEGDALGSVLGFYNLIKKLGKQAVIIIDDRLPYGYDFLPGARHIRRLNTGMKYPKFDCLVVLDCADLKRTGGVHKLNRQNKPVMNIDHHISNQFFGETNWVDAQASSCSEMIYKLYKQLRLTLDRDSALVLYTGIMTDTGSFRYSNTAVSTFNAAAELLKFGVNVAQVYRYTYENIPAPEAKLLLKILSKIKFFGHGQIAAFEISPESSGSKKTRIDLADQALSFGRAIQGVEAVVLFRKILKSKSQVRVNLRSQGRVDVNKIAAFFKGGGHKTAAGCTVFGKLPAVRSKVIAKIYRALRK